jgi:hypothetical protein
MCGIKVDRFVGKSSQRFSGDSGVARFCDAQGE